MTMYLIYHNPRCKKSRAGLQFLEENGLTFEIKKYLDEGLTADELKAVFEKMGRRPGEMIRKQEEVYKKQYKGKQLTDDEWIEAIIKNPKLLNRPIVVHGDKAVWGDPPENIKAIMD